MSQAKTNWSHIGGRVLALILVVALAASYMSIVPAEAYTPAIAEGKRLPDITLQDSDGNSVKLAPKDGRMLYVLYWNDIYIGLNRRNLGRVAVVALSSLVDEFDAKGVDVVVVHPAGIGYIEDWLEVMDFQFPVLWDNTQFMEEVLERYTVRSFGVDNKGIVRVFRSGYGHTVYDNIIRLRYDLDRLVKGDDAEYQGNMPAVGTIAPAMVLKDFTGKMVDTSVFRGESPVCYLFWDAGCGFSRSTQVRLIELYPEFYARGVKFVSIDISPESPWHTLQYFAADSHNAMPFINLRDEFGLARRAYGVFGTPSMVVADKNGTITFSGSGDDIHNADLREVLGAVAGQQLPGAGSGPSGERQPLVSVSGEFDGLKVLNDPLLNQSQIDALAAGLRQGLDKIYHNLGVDGRLFANSDAQLVFYADPLRYYEDAGAGCSSIGYCLVDLNNGPSVRIYVQWVTDVETTLFVARHELVHALLRLRVKQVPPLWFDEGCADAFSRNQDAEYYTVMHNLDRKPSADQLSNWWGDSRYEADAREIAHAVINYILHEYGHEGFLSLLFSMEAGNSLEKAVELTFGVVNFQHFWTAFWDDVPVAAERSWANIVNESKFEDVSFYTFGHDQVNFLAELGVIPASGKFDPRRVMTRGEFAQLLVDTLWLPQNLVQIIANPQERLYRYDAAAMVVEALGLKTMSPPEDWNFFVNWNSVPEYAPDHVWTAFCHNIIDRNLLLGGSYDEGQNVTINSLVSRLEGAVWIARAFNVRLYLMDHPQVQTLNVGYEDVEPRGDDDHDPPTQPGDGKPGLGQLGSRPWLALVGGSFIILAGGGLFIFLKRRKAKISA